MDLSQDVDVAITDNGDGTWTISLIQIGQPTAIFTGTEEQHRYMFGQLARTLYDAIYGA